MTSIGYGAFYGCSGLTNVVSRIAVPFAFESNAFTGISTKCVLTVPSRTRTAYIAAGWTTTVFKGGVVEGSESYCDFTVGGIHYQYIADKYRQVAVSYAHFNLDSDLDYVENLSDDYYSGSIIIPSTVTYNSVTYKVTAVSDFAFYECPVTSVTLPSSITSIGKASFSDCTSLQSMSLPQSVTSIGDYAFDGCVAMSSINIPDGVVSINYKAFSSCRSLTSITIPSSVTSIGSAAFYGCSGLTSITIPSSVTSIGSAAFYGCSGLTSVVSNIAAPFTFGSSAFTGISTNCVLTVPKGSRDAYISAGWNEEVFKGGVVEGSHAIAFASAFVKAICVANWDTNGDGELSEAEAAAVTDLGTVFSRKYSDQYPSFSFDELRYFTGLTSICEDAFYMSDALTSVIIPENVTAIEESAFSNCWSLTSVTIPDNVTTFGDYAFNGTSLTSVTIPSRLGSIGKDAFWGCSSLTAVHITDFAAWCNVSFVGGQCNPLSFAHHLYLNGEEIKDFVVPTGITFINNLAYSGLTSITIPESVTSIGSSAFAYCSSLTSIAVESGNTVYDSRNNCNAIIETATNTLVAGCMNTTIPNSVTSIGDYAFSGYSGLTSITIPNSVTSIGSGAFSGCGLTSVIIPNSVTEFGRSAFYNCSSLNSITIPNSVTSIGYAAFKGCSSLTSITLPESLTSISDFTFSDCCGLTSIIIPNGVTNIGSFAFGDCKNLTSITIPNSVTNMGYDPFIRCTSLTDVYCYAEIVPNTNKNSEAFSDTPIGSATLHVPAASLEAYSTTAPWSGFGNIVAIDNSPIIEFADATVKALCVANWDTNGDGELSEAEAAAVTSLGTYFKNNKTISSFDELQYFTGLTSIDTDAFNGCTGLTSITIPNSVTSIGDNAFRGCSGLTSITIPNSVTSIDEYAFYKCISLTDVWCYAENVPSTDTSAFSNSPISSTTLYVPKASMALYKTTAPWSGFGAIVPIEGYTTFNINDEMASLDIATEESECIVNFTHEFNGNWEALYLPFAIDYDAIREDFDLAEIDGVVQNDDDNDGVADITVLSIIGFKEQMTEPNTPYLIRAKSAGKQTISFDDVTVYPTTIASLDCSSTSVRYEFTGSYNTLNASDLANCYIVQDGELTKGASNLAPCRWYMTATARKGSLNLPAKIRIMPVEDVITGSPLLTSPEEEGQVYNLAGQRLNKMQKGINIVNGKKVLKR